MNKDVVRLHVSLNIGEGKFEEFERTAKAMVEGTEKEKGSRAYDFYLSADRKKCRLVETYENADALRTHVRGPVVQDLVPKLLQSSTLSGFEVYGQPDPEVAKTFAGLSAEIFQYWRGLNR